MRFANKLEFGDRSHEVSMTAQRLVQRMKKDFIHSGRRPSGLCGAALLLAARMHDFNRTPMDVIRIVKIHESTLRKRLLEFGETPSSALTLDEFMNVDLEAEHDPPAFKAARRRDKERIQKLTENDAEFTNLQSEIDAQLEKDLKNSKKRKNTPVEDTETNDTDTFIRESTIDIIQECLVDPDDPDEVLTARIAKENQGLKPDIAAMCLPSPIPAEEQTCDTENGNLNELDIEGLDDDEINGYIMTDSEARYKDMMWNTINAEYIKEMKEKEERLAKEREEGKPEKKKRRVNRRKNIGPSNTAGEAIEKMLQEKKISSKINYDILKTLTSPRVIAEEIVVEDVNEAEGIKIETNLFSASRYRSEVPSIPRINTVRPSPATKLDSRKLKSAAMGLPVGDDESSSSKKPETVTTAENDDLDDFEEDPEPEPEPEPEHSSLADMLNNGNDEEYYGYDEDY